MVFDDVFAVIAEETRRDILLSLKAGDKAVGELVEELGASQPTISKHLRVLREASLVTMRAEGQRRYYSLNAGPLERISSWLTGLGLAAFNGVPAPALHLGDGSLAGSAADNPAVTSALDSPAGSAVTSAAGSPVTSALDSPAGSAVTSAAGSPVDSPAGSAVDSPPRVAATDAKPSAAVPDDLAGQAFASRGFATQASVAQAEVAAAGASAVVGTPVVPAPDGTRPQQLGRSVGRAANKAADLLANLPKFGRRRD